RQRAVCLELARGPGRSLVEFEIYIWSVREERMNDHNQLLPIEREAAQLEFRRETYHQPFRVTHAAVRAHRDRAFVARARTRRIDHLELRQPDLPPSIITNPVLRPLGGVREPRVLPSREQVRIQLELLCDLVDRG